MAINHTNQRPISIKPPAVAGSFYPDDTNQLSLLLDDYLEKASAKILPPKAIIAPHAGYRYSGEVAASIYSNMKQLNSKIKRVVLLGPAHRVFVNGIALPSYTHFATPLGNVAINTEVLNQLESLSNVQYQDIAFKEEHSLEVQLPFLQKVLNNFTLVPLLVGKASTEHVADILNKLWGGEETLIVISSDLSHFHDYETASEKDRATSQLIENFEYSKIDSDQACGCMPMRGLLKLAQDKNMHAQTIELCNSGDTAGSKERVVGYGAYAFFDSANDDSILNDRDKKVAFDVIHKSIEQGFKNETAYVPITNEYNHCFSKNYAVFITLKLHGQLRGCIGTTEAHTPLINAVAQYAYAAAFSDPRFKPLTEDEYRQTEISLSILTPATQMEFNNETDLINQLRPEIDGLIIEKSNCRATFLPVVWESLKQPTQFLQELKKKAGICTSDTPDKAWRYTAEYYSL